MTLFKKNKMETFTTKITKRALHHKSAKKTIVLLRLRSMEGFFPRETLGYFFKIF